MAGEKIVEENKPIIVFGGTGFIGRYIVESLLKKGVPVRVLSRNAARAREVLGEEPEIVEGDICTPSVVEAALNNVRAIIIGVSAFSPQLIRKMELIERDAVLSLLEQAEKAGIHRVVYLSAYQVREDVLDDLNLSMPIARIKLEVEQALADSTASLNWTVLGLAPSMRIYFEMLHGNSMMVPGGGPRSGIPTVSPVDVGEIAAQTVLRLDLKGQRFRVTGPEALSFAQAAERISVATGRSIRYRAIPLFPLHFVSIVTRPFNPFLWHLFETIRLMNGFPQDLVQAVPNDHRRLLATFDYVPNALDAEAKRQM